MADNDAFYTLEQLKKQCRVDWSDDDEMIQLYGDTAFEAVSTYLDRKIIPESQTPVDFTEVAYNKKIKMAIFLITDDLYNNRGSQNDYQIYENAALKLLLDPMKRLYIGISA
ncbi:putative head-tail connector protein [Serratia phage vB_SmaS_Opt-169]|uniref:Putative head-tail connector protein n=1 Tax=Serratia phage vB_SmaS_Rovert TaxID=2777363 RepID=A0A7T3N9Q0_9CAUD|nr:putative head-tail connector protein [Serratia phage vB_SmaS_Rovert]QPX74974.1 putative head-tail connector protein [Serratia phage vB_SmaS_Rovert]QPX75420.1 putative head-tail connector protein [Serratia phage vB_SmaS_Opt-169]UGO51947.1 putative upper head-tail connector protein [Serratia phage vB_SmaS_PhooPhighters]